MFVSLVGASCSKRKQTAHGHLLELRFSCASGFRHTPRCCIQFAVIVPWEKVTSATVIVASLVLKCGHPDIDQFDHQHIPLHGHLFS